MGKQMHEAKKTENGREEMEKTWLNMRLFSALWLWHMFLSVLTLAPEGPATRLNVRITSFIKTWTGRDPQSSAEPAKRALCVVVPHLVPPICALHLCHDTPQTHTYTHTGGKLCGTEQPWWKVWVLSGQQGSVPVPHVQPDALLWPFHTRPLYHMILIVTSFDDT